MISKEEYNSLKELANFLAMEQTKTDIIRYPQTHSQYGEWVTIIYKILKDARVEIGFS